MGTSICGLLQNNDIQLSPEVHKLKKSKIFQKPKNGFLKFTL